jgi:hypothetical protein
VNIHQQEEQEATFQAQKDSPRDLLLLRMSSSALDDSFLRSLWIVLYAIEKQTQIPHSPVIFFFMLDQSHRAQLDANT